MTVRSDEETISLKVSTQSTQTLKGGGGLRNTVKQEHLVSDSNVDV